MGNAPPTTYHYYIITAFVHPTISSQSCHVTQRFSRAFQSRVSFPKKHSIFTPPRPSHIPNSHSFSLSPHIPLFPSTVESHTLAMTLSPAHLDVIDKIKTAPELPGVYIFRAHDNTILYIGKAKSLKARLRSYLLSSSSSTAPACMSRKTFAMVRQACALEYVLTETESAALLLEANMIRRHHPFYNVLLKDDKRYPYVVVTHNEEYPRMLVTRRKVDTYKQRSKLSTHSSSEITHVDTQRNRYYGPFVDVKNIYTTLRIVQKAFPLRQRKTPLFTNRPCINYHIGKCPGVCQRLMDPATYRNRNLKYAEMVLQGRLWDVLQELQGKMMAASDALDFENAAAYRDQYVLLHSQLWNPDTPSNVEGIASAYPSSTRSSTPKLSLDSHQTNSVIIADSELDVDVVACAAATDNSSLMNIQLLQIRTGKIVNRLAFVSVASQTLDSNDNCPEDLEEVQSLAMQRALEDHYSRCESVAEFPDRIVTMTKLPDPDMIKALFLSTVESEMMNGSDVFSKDFGEGGHVDSSPSTPSVSSSNGRRKKLHRPENATTATTVDGDTGCGSARRKILISSIGSVRGEDRMYLKSLIEMAHHNAKFQVSLMKQDDHRIDLEVKNLQDMLAPYVRNEDDTNRSRRCFLLSESQDSDDDAEGQASFEELGSDNNAPPIGALLEDDTDVTTTNQSHPTYTMECYDISHTSGTLAVGSKVVFVDGKPDKSRYRKFNISVQTTSLGKPDDYMSLKETLLRRFKKSSGGGIVSDIPDLVVIDGGKGQLNAALEVLDPLFDMQNRAGTSKKPMIISLAKKYEHVYVRGRVLPINADTGLTAGVKLLCRIRDEAHRFAITSHRKRRAKSVYPE